MTHFCLKLIIKKPNDSKNYNSKNMMQSEDRHKKKWSLLTFSSVLCPGLIEINKDLSDLCFTFYDMESSIQLVLRGKVRKREGREEKES